MLIHCIRYWRGESIPRCLTLFVGGNHEAPGHLREMYFGGYASKDIFYLGHSGVFKVGGMRVVGVSGIYKSQDFEKPIFEAPPYSEQTKRSAYHVRKYEIEKLMLIREPVDIVVSHDWPSGITSYGDTESLLRMKDRTGQLRQEIQTNTLGNPHTMRLLKKLKPRYWFAGHMHAKYAALYQHEDGSVTRFLALDKCVPRRSFLQLIRDLETKDSHQGVFLDLEWLAILKVNNGLLPVQGPCPTLRSPTNADLEHVRTLLQNSKAEQPEPGRFLFPYFGQTSPGNNQYRQWMCELLEMSDRMAQPGEASAVPPPAVPDTVVSPDALFYIDY